MRRGTVVLGAAALTGATTLLGGATAWAVATAAPAPGPVVLRPPTQLTPDQMRSDIAAFARAVVEVGADPFRTCPRADFERLRAVAETECAEPRSTATFALALRRLAAALNDGHVSVWNTPYAWRWADDEHVFPLTLGIDRDDALIVTSSAVANVPAGSRVFAVDGRPAQDLVVRTIAVTGGQTPALRRAFGRPRELLDTLDGSRRTYHVVLAPPDGTQRTMRLEGVRASAVRAAAPPPPDYAFRMTPDRLAVIDYNACRDRDAFASFLRGAFQRVRDERARAVVVDVRANGGGSSSVNDELWPYLSGRPFGSNTGMRCRSSARLKREYGPFRYLKVYRPRALFAPDGTLVEYAPSRRSVNPRATPLRASVPTFMLVGPSTFSSALDCALVASDFRLTTLVGEETAEPVNGTGETYSFALRASRLCATVTTKLYFTPPHPDGRGVSVDVAAPRTLRDVASGRDPGLDAVRQTLK